MLQIRVLGGLQILQDEQSLSQFMSHKVPALLAYLAVTQRPHSRDGLATLLWGDMGEADAKNNLRQALSNLRKFVEPYLIISRETVEFNTAAPHNLDSADFLKLLHTAPFQDTAAQIESYQQAATLYQGEFLAGFLVRQAPDFEEWASLQRERLHNLAVQALHILTNGYLATRAYPAAIESAGRLLQLDQWREEAHTQLILALARSGQRAAALQHYAQWHRRLESELGAEPSAELTLLAARVRESLQKSRPPLPAPTTPLLERSHELAKVRRLLTDRTCRLLTLTGPGGVGKSRLALEVATTTQSDFLNGATFVALAGVSADSPDGVLFAIIDALQITLAGSTSPLQQLTTAIRSKELLLVLDNLEHLLEQVGWLDNLLQHAPDVKILATSQERLALSGEWVMEVDSLPIPNTSDPAMVQMGAGLLFVTAARRAWPAFKVTAANAADIRRICELVGGLPLGLTLAAVWVQNLSCAKIAHEIGETLDFLSGIYRDMPPRQRSLRAVFDHAWRRLPTEEQNAFASLAVFQGTFNHRAAQQVTAVNQPLLSKLVDKSLLRSQKDRYDLQPVLRQYATEQLDLESQLEYQARYAAYFAAWLAQFESDLHTAQETEIFRAMREDYDNLRAYWQWAVRYQQVPLLAQGLTTLRVFYSEQNRYQEGMGVMERTVAMLAPLAQQPDHAAARQLLGRVLTAWGIFCLWGGQQTQAHRLFEQALPLLQPFDNSADLGSLLLNWGYLTVQDGDYPTAERQFSASLQYQRRAEDGHGIASTLSALGALCNVTGDLERAGLYLAESVAISQQIGDENGLRSSLTNLGNVYYLQGNKGRAKTYYLDVLPLCRKVADRSSEAVILSNLGTLAQDSGNLDEAEAYFQAGLTIFKELSSWHYVIHGTAALANVHVAQGQVRRARLELRWALQKALTEQIQQVVPLVVYEIALLYAAIGEPAAALELFYWVLAHPATLAEHKQGAEARRGGLEAQVGRGGVAQARRGAARLTAEGVLAGLMNFDQKNH